MKSLNFLYSGISILMAVILLPACEKNGQVINHHLTGEQALLKINYASPYRLNPSVQLKVNDVRVSSAVTYAYPFPGGGLNTGGGSTPLYFEVKPGSTKLSISIPKRNSDADSIVLYNSTVNLEAGKIFTAHISDTLANTKTYLVAEDVVPSDTGRSKYKFVNLIPNLAAVDLYFGTTLVAGNVPYNGSSAYFTLPFDNKAQWFIRPAGAAATSTALTNYPTSTTLYSVPNRRILTVYARGYNGITAATDVRRPQVSLLYNR